MKHRTISADSLEHEFRLLRNRIETGIEGPAIVFVTSATDDDGASFAAHGIASSMSRTHQRTVLVTGDPGFKPPQSPEPGAHRRRASDRAETGSLLSSNGGFSIVCLSAERIATISRTRVAEMVQELKSSNDYIVVDGGNLSKNGLGLLLVASADIAIVAFRAGRAEQPDDRLMLDALERAEAKVFGVVMTDQESIAHFAHTMNPETTVTEAVVERVAPQRAMLRRLELALNRLVRSF